MSLILLCVVPIIGGLFAWYSERLNERLPKIIGLITLVICCGVLWVCVQGVPWSFNALIPLSEPAQLWIDEFNAPWIPRFGISWHFAMDGLSLLLIILTLISGFVAVLSSSVDGPYRAGFLMFNLLAVIGGLMGVFLALDLFVFFFFWEVMLIPMVLIIGIWGGNNRSYAALKFFIFTQASSLLMLVSIMVLVFLNWRSSGYISFDYFDLLNTPMVNGMGLWLMLGMFLAFAVKLPVVPFHGWLPDAHTEAPTAGSVLLAAILLKTGAYGMIRFLIPLFPEATIQFAPVAIVLAVISILYGAQVAFAQGDLKRLIAYSSVSHMGFVLLGVFSFSMLAMQGAVMQLVAHGLSTAGLFVMAGLIKQRFHTRDLSRLSGLWQLTPRMGAFMLFFAVASLGLPGLANFIGEFLVLMGAFQVYPLAASVAALGMILAAVYSIYMLRKTFWGMFSSPTANSGQSPDVNAWGVSGLLALVLLLVGLGFYPQPIFNSTHQALVYALSFIEQETFINVGLLPK